MKKLLIFLGILLVPLMTGAVAYNDVTLTTDAIISVGGIDLNVSGSSAVVESITVNSSNFSFILSSGSSITVTSAAGRKFSTNADSKYIAANGCNDSIYTLKHSSSFEGSVTITVTPDDSSCPTSTGASSSNTGGSHRSGGGSSSAAPSPSPTAIAVVATTPAAGKAVFARLLSVGSTGDDVRNLQTRLSSEGLFKGEATGYFGPLTKAAVKAYQAKHGIDQLGIVGPATRAQLNKDNTVGATTISSQLTPTQISAIMAQINALLQQVQELQAKLKTLGN